jgi:competence protein ComEA
MAVRIEEFIEDLAARAGLEGLSPRLVLAVLIVSVGLFAFAALRWLPPPTVLGAGGAEGGVTLTAASTDESSAASVPPSSQATLLVHVDGAVHHPGVYELRVGSRVIDAVEAAGGMLGDALGSAVNLARPLGDGEQVIVPDEDGTFAPAPLVTSAAGAVASGSALINVNTATPEALESLPGVGPATAAKIVQDREANGPFACVEDMGRVSGIGPKRIESLQGLVSF